MHWVFLVHGTEHIVEPHKPKVTFQEGGTCSLREMLKKNKIFLVLAQNYWVGGFVPKKNVFLFLFSLQIWVFTHFFLTFSLGNVSIKKWKFNGQADRNSPFDQLFVFLRVSFDLKSWFSMTWNKFWRRKKSSLPRFVH